MERKISSKVETWINQETGEVRQVQEIEVKATDKGFDKVWLGMILAVLEIIGSKKIDVIKYLLENRSRTENTVTVSQHKIAKDVGVSVQTVNETMKKLAKDIYDVRDVFFIVALVFDILPLNLVRRILFDSDF